MRRRRLTPLDAHLRWLAGREPSAALADAERDFSEAPIMRWLREHERQLAAHRKGARPYNNRRSAGVTP